MPSPFAENVRSLLRQQGLSLKQAASKGKISYDWLRRACSRGLSRQTKENREHVEKLARLLNVPADQLWEVRQGRKKVIADYVEMLRRLMERHIEEDCKYRDGHFHIRTICDLICRLHEAEELVASVLKVDPLLGEFFRHRQGALADEILDLKAAKCKDLHGAILAKKAETLREFIGDLKKNHSEDYVRLHEKYGDELEVVVYREMAQKTDRLVKQDLLREAIQLSPVIQKIQAKFAAAKPSNAPKPKEPVQDEFDTVLKEIQTHELWEKFVESLPNRRDAVEQVQRGWIAAKAERMSPKKFVDAFCRTMLDPLDKLDYHRPKKSKAKRD